MRARSKGLSSINRLISSIRSLHKYLLLNEIIDKDPTKLLKSIKVKQSLPTVLNVDEIDLLIVLGKQALVKHGKWLSNGSSNLSTINFPIDLDLFNAFPLLVDKKYFFEITTVNLSGGGGFFVFLLVETYF